MSSRHFFALIKKKKKTKKKTKKKKKKKKKRSSSGSSIMSTKRSRSQSEGRRATTRGGEFDDDDEFDDHMVVGALWRLVTDRPEIFESHVATKLNGNDAKFFYDVNRESRRAMQRSKVRLADAFKIRDFDRGYVVVCTVTCTRACM